MVALAVLLGVFAVSEVVSARRSHAPAPAGDMRARITACRLDSASHLVLASGSVANGSRVGAPYAFSVAFDDAASDQEVVPVTVGVVPPGRSVPFTARSRSPFPAGRVTCVLADLNPPGQL
jgi:hypothetical protein